eukprot:6236470-Ditylum_brightwellii.AAC.1
MKKGKCCTDELCKHEKLELCPQHNYAVYKGVVHLLCGSLNEETDEHCCLKCSSKQKSKHSPHPKENKGKKCKLWGGYGHERKSSRLCPHYGQKKPQQGTKELRYKPVTDFFSHDAEFKIIQRNDRMGQKEMLNSTPEVLLHH